MGAGLERAAARPPGSRRRPSRDRRTGSRPRSRRRRRPRSRGAASASTPGSPPVTYGTNARPPAVASAAERGLELTHRASSSPSAASTVSRSLSPRPDRQTRMRAPSGSGRCRSHPITCEGSSAGHDPLGARERLEPLERLRVGRAHVPGEPGVLQVRVLGPDARVVEPGRDRVRLDDLAVGVLQQVAERAVQHAGLPLRDRRAVLPELHPAAARLDADQLDAGCADERREHPDRVRAAAHAREHVGGIAAHPLRVLGARLVADHALEVAHELRERVRPDDRADDVVGVRDAWRPSRGAPRSRPPSGSACRP